MRVIRNSLGQLIKPVGLQADTKKGIIMLSKPFNFLKNYKFVSFSILLSVLLTTGCSFTAKIENQPVSQLPKNDERYTSANFVQQHPEGDTILLLAFSGGGTRAAAMSYGVLEELRDTQFQINGDEKRLLDEVDRISSVSGGSFTSAYYGLFGDQIFDDFKDVFLYEDVQGELSSQILDFFKIIGRVFSSTSRTETAINYYDKHIFHGKTFADIQKSGGPIILINATDLSSHSQFIFTQSQFDFLCSNLSEFKVARAVAASSAVPIVFPPVLIERHDNCYYEKPAWLIDAEEEAKQKDDGRMKDIVESLNFYLDKENPPYVTLLDGGVTDNLGLRTILRSVSLSGGAEKSYKQTQNQLKHIKPPKQLALIVVNASTVSKTAIGTSKTLPSMADTLTAVTDIQLHLYNTETVSLLKDKLNQWTKTLSTDEHRVVPYFIDLNVSDIQDPEERQFFNKIPTSFSLEKEQVDKLIDISRRLLRENPEYQKLLLELNDSNPVI